MEFPLLRLYDINVIKTAVGIVLLSVFQAPVGGVNPSDQQGCGTPGLPGI